MSDGNDADSRTSANLTSAGGQSIPQYLQGAFPTTDTSNAASATSASVAADRPARTMAQAFGIPDGTFGGIVSAGEDSSQSSQDDEEQDTSDVPLYIKVKGKGKGRPVMFDRSRSSVAQLHEYAAQMSVRDPVFTHTSTGAAHFLSFTVTVRFDGLKATNLEFAGSIKEAKEQACLLLIEKLLIRNRDERGFAA